MTPADERVLEAAMRWFRNKLRRDTTLQEFEEPLFSAIAARQSTSPDVFTPRERSPAPTTHVASTADVIPTKPPPSEFQTELLRLSRTETPSTAGKGERRKAPG